jgi:hypothetical protein
MVEIPRLQFVMPANAGIQVRFGSSSKTAWIPPNDGNKSRLPVDKFRTPLLGAEGCSV